MMNRTAGFLGWGLLLMTICVLALTIQSRVCSAPVGQNPDRGTAMLQIYRFPFGAETLTPVTSENIQKRGSRCEISDGLNVSEVKKILLMSRPPVDPDQVFSDMRVRVLILEKGDAGLQALAAIENEGQVRTGTVEAFLTNEGLSQLKQILKVACGRKRP